MSGRLIQMKR